jgi:hypothetical protein
MRITCPDCGFSREVPDDKVPATTAVATCPKCRSRFRFRHFEDGFDAPSSSVHDARYVEEPEDDYRARPGYGASTHAPEDGRQERGAAQDRPYDPQAAETHAYGHSGLRRRQERGFPPPSAHWEPAAPMPEPPATPDPDEAHELTPPAASPSPPRHDEERLRADVRGTEPPRSNPTQPMAPEFEHNGVRDIWARLQAMDDEETPRPAPPRPAAPRGADVQAPREAPEHPPGQEAAHARKAAPDAPEAFPPAGPQTGPAHDADADSAPASGAPGQTGEASGWDSRGSADPTPDEERRDVPRPQQSAPDPDPEEASWRPSSGRPAGEPTPGEVPWERPDAYGFFPGLMLTLKRILFQPVDFFETMPPGRGKGKAMVFNLILSEFLLLVDFLWALVGVRAKLADTGQTDALAAMAGVPGIGFLALLVMVPIFMAAGIFLDAGLTHLLLMLLRGSSKKFDETFRVMCYSAAPTVLSAVPVAGQLLSPVILIWYMTLQAIGLKKVHGAAYSQALAVVLIKWSLYLFLLLGMLHGLSSGG